MKRKGLIALSSLLKYVSFSARYTMQNTSQYTMEMYSFPYMKTPYMKKVYMKNIRTKSVFLVSLPLHSTYDKPFKLHWIWNKTKSSEISYCLLSWNSTPRSGATHWLKWWNFLHRGWMHCIISLHYLF